jgi:hypothetical protein
MQRRVARTGERPAPTRGRIARTCSADPLHIDPARSHPAARHSHVGPPRSHSQSADVHVCAGHPAHAAARPDHCSRAARTVLQPAGQQVPARCAATANGLATAHGRSRSSCRLGRTAFPVARTRSQDGRTKHRFARTWRRLIRTGTRIGRTDRQRVRTNSRRHCIHFHSRSHGPAGRRAGWVSRLARVTPTRTIREDRLPGSRGNPCRRSTVSRDKVSAAPRNSGDTDRHGR